MKQNGNEQIKNGKLSQFRPAEQNANLHTQRGLKLLTKAMGDVGYVAPITVAADGEAIDGSARLETAFETFGDEALVIRHDGTKPVVMVREDIPNAKTPEAKRIAYEANRIAQIDLSWNIEQLLADYESGLDLTDLWSDDEMAALLEGAADRLLGEGGKDAEPQIDKAAELQKQWGTAVGQVWSLGEHRLAVGDCTDRATVEAVMRGERAEMMFTDPPYGVDYTGGHFHSGDVNIKRERPRLANDNDTGVYARFLPVVLPFVDGPCYVWFASSVGKPVYDAITENNCEIHAMIIWHKINATYAAVNAQYKQRHEPCMYFKPKGSTLRWVGPTNECTLWEIKRDSVNEYHPTQKPIELAMRAMGNHSAKIVIDCFIGSGSTIIAGENLGRKVRAIEIDPGYAAVSLQRFLDATGIEPKLLQ